MVEQTKYEIEKAAGNIEIRKYQRMMLATVYGLPDNTAFSMLFDYIAGNNRSRRKIQMTTPVISSEKIAMTAPVISDNRSFSFALPSDFDVDSTPEPLDEKVRVEEVRARRVAVIRFRGRARARDISERTSELISFSAKQGLRTKGEPFLMRYNPPFMPGFLRRNEVGIELE